MIGQVFKKTLGGRELIVETGKYAGLTNGAAMVRYGDTAVLVTAAAAKEAKPDMDFFPLTCDYEERSYAAGKIPGGFLKREGRATERATLACRLMDRPLRPLFPKGYYNNVQVVATVMSVDHDCAAEIVAMIGSSIALSISDIPFQGPTGSVLIGLVDDEYVLNPTSEQREKSQMHLVVSGTKDAIMMVEAGANEVSETVMRDGILFAHEQIKDIITFVEEIQEAVGKEKADPKVKVIDPALEEEVLVFAREKMKEAVLTPDKTERLENIAEVEAETKAYFTEKYEGVEKDVNGLLYKVKKEQVRRLILEDGIRPDNRKETEIRPIWCDNGVLPRAHGTGLFTRGETQVLTVATLGSVREGQRLDGLGEETDKTYIHHYNFPPYSVGEAGFMRGPGRREIGHGALAERALVPVLPELEKFPYAIRLVSEAIASNGSTSQASVCGSTLALMDAGVPIKKPVSGIAMGLIKEDDKLAILSDIQGMEDFLGDMDFKVAGTKDGITAIQMDIKIHGIDEEILTRALNQAKEGRAHILNIMLETLAEPKAELSQYAPKIYTISVPPEKIGMVIGGGGKTINKIIEDTGVKIDIDDDGTIYIVGIEKDKCDQAIATIQALVKDVEVGEVYEGKVVKVTAFGAFIELLPGKEGLLHISKIAKEKVNKVEDYMNVGDRVTVKVSEINPQGKINLRMETLL